MTQKRMHPSVMKFKEFVRNNPKLIQEVRKGNATWQELYEDWYLLGENDKRWETIGVEKDKLDSKEEKKNESMKKGEWLTNAMGMVKKMDPAQVQYHMNNLSQAIGAIQGLLAQFQAGSQQPNSPAMREHAGPKDPFSFRKD